MKLYKKLKKLKNYIKRKKNEKKVIINKILIIFQK